MGDCCNTSIMIMSKAFQNALAGIALACLCQLGAAAEPLSTIPSLDLPRYLGSWYEIAKYPNRFQRECKSATMAQYSRADDGTVTVVNRCRRDDGSISEAVGSARQVGPATSPVLKVRFAPRWLSFLPFVWGDYWVIDLDNDYQLAAVSEPKREYLWILSRQPKVDPVAYDSLLARLRAKGFDLGKLEPTPQDAAATVTPAAASR